MMLVTFASPSHFEMCERFVVSNAKDAGFTELVFHKANQICESGNYNTTGFAEAMLGKLELLANIPIGERICYVDADCLILPGLADWCEDWLHKNPQAIGHGKDANQFGMGTLVFEQSSDTKKWWSFIHQLAWMVGLHDQTTLNALTSAAVRSPVALLKLDNEVFSNWATYGDIAKKYWQGEELIVPGSTLCWHANWCIGIRSKIYMLEIVGKVLTELSV